MNPILSGCYLPILAFKLLANSPIFHLELGEKITTFFKYLSHSLHFTDEKWRPTEANHMSSVIQFFGSRTQLEMRFDTYSYH